jgi:hypothetical protein
MRESDKRHLEGLKSFGRRLFDRFERYYDEVATVTEGTDLFGDYSEGLFEDFMSCLESFCSIAFRPKHFSTGFLYSLLRDVETVLKEREGTNDDRTDV